MPRPPTGGLSCGRFHQRKPTNSLALGREWAHLVTPGGSGTGACNASCPCTSLRPYSWAVSGMPGRGQMDVRRAKPEASDEAVTLRTFLIADIRGYTAFTREHGDEAAARLAMRFAELARDAVEARSGEVVELRGDEALAVFTSSSQAIRAALELQAACEEETAEDPTLPLPVGIGM